MYKEKYFSQIALLLFLYFIIYYLFRGFLYPIPGLGDSWDYHIPISLMILNGAFLHPTYVLLPQWYYPGSSEAINALFILFRIPLTVSNLFAILVLFFVLWKVGLTFGLRFYNALLFGIAFCSLTVLMRWADGVSIDVWVAVFFSLTLVLLQQPQKSIRYFFALGFISGMLTGSKYTAVLFLLLLFIFYGKNLLRSLSFFRVFVFLIPLSFFGLFWYIRNAVFQHNPFYPLCVFHLPCYQLFPESVLQGALQHPFFLLDALMSEYKLWIFVPVFFTAFILKQFKKRSKSLDTSILKLILIGFSGFILFLTFPTTNSVQIMISSLRYSYPVMIPFMLAFFLLAQAYKKEQLLGFFVIANMLPVLSMSYYPKLIFIYFPVALLSFFLIEKLEVKKLS